MRNKENNCTCVVCQVERSLIDSLSTQTARIHFQALAANHSVLNHFDSPADVIARLHEHEQVEADNHNAWNGILHAVVDGLADRSTEDIGQQLLLVAYAPAIHKVYREVCQRFPRLAPEDIAQQAAVFFLENAKSPSMAQQNGHLPVALVKYFRRRLFRWAIRETRQSLPLQEGFPQFPEPVSEDGFEDAVLLNQFLAKAQRVGVISQYEANLIRKFHCEGCQPDELRDGARGPSGIALYYRVQRAVHRLRRIALSDAVHGNRRRSTHVNLSDSKNSSSKALELSGEMSIRNSEKGFSPELSHHVPQVEPDIAQTAA
jgi:hypothetical protein